MSKNPQIPPEVIRKLQAKTKPPREIKLMQQGYFRLPVFGDVAGIHETDGLVIFQLETKTGETVDIPLDQQALDRLRNVLDGMQTVRLLKAPPQGNA